MQYRERESVCFAWSTHHTPTRAHIPVQVVHTRTHAKVKAHRAHASAPCFYSRLPVDEDSTSTRSPCVPAQTSLATPVAPLTLTFSPCDIPVCVCDLSLGRLDCLLDAGRTASGQGILAFDRRKHDRNYFPASLPGCSPDTYIIRTLVSLVAVV